MKDQFLDTIRLAFDNIKSIDLLKNIVNTPNVKFVYFGDRQIGGEQNRYGYKIKFKVINSLCVGKTINNKIVGSGKHFDSNAPNTYGGYGAYVYTKSGYKIFDCVKNKEKILSDDTIVFILNNKSIYDEILLIDESITIMDSISKITNG